MGAQLSQLLAAHEKSSQHWKALVNDGMAFCFYCRKSVLFDEIKEWIDDKGTAICPKCGIDSLLPPSAIPENFTGRAFEFLEEMHRYWFSGSREFHMKDGKARIKTTVAVLEETDLSLAELQREAHENSAAKGFWDEVDGQKPDIGSKLMLITSEVSEAMEEYRKGTPLDYVYTVDGKPEGFGVELADAVIRIADLAEHAKVDLSALIRLKMRFNKTRPKMHGKRV